MQLLYFALLSLIESYYNLVLKGWIYIKRTTPKFKNGHFVNLHSFLKNLNGSSDLQAKITRLKITQLENVLFIKVNEFKLIQVKLI